MSIRSKYERSFNFRKKIINAQRAFREARGEYQNTIYLYGFGEVKNVTSVHGFPDVVYFKPLNPVTKGHLLFVHKKQIVSPSDSSKEDIVGELFTAISSHLQNSGLGVYDYNLIVNKGSSASQTIWQLHVHYVPRKSGDKLKLPWTEQL